MKIQFNSIEITGQKIDKVWKDCLHLDADEFSHKTIMNDSNRIWLKLDKTIKDLHIAIYPYKMASFNKNSITIIED